MAMMKSVDWSERGDRTEPMPSGFGAYVDSLWVILEMAGRAGITPTRLRARVRARFGSNERWLRNILSFLVNVGLLRQDGDRIRAAQTSPSPERVIRSLHGSIKFVGEMVAEIERSPLTHDGVAKAARERYGLVLGTSRINDRRGWLESAGMITATGRPRTLKVTRRGRTLLGNLEKDGLLVPPVGSVTSGPVIVPNDENLKSEHATVPLTAWLIHAAKSHGTMTYAEAKRRLEEECGFGRIFTVRMGRAAGAAMDRIQDHSPRAPLLNVLLVQAGTRLPGAGAPAIWRGGTRASVGLRRKDAYRHADWRSVIEEEVRRVYAYPRWDALYREVYGRRLPGAAPVPPGREMDGNGGSAARVRTTVR